MKLPDTGQFPRTNDSDTRFAILQEKIETLQVAVIWIYLLIGFVAGYLLMSAVW